MNGIKMKIRLIDKKQEADGTKSFYWEPEAKVNWLPGQYFYYTLPKLKFSDTRGATRHFTISSSPTEGPILRLTTRIRDGSGYKKTLDSLELDTQIEGEGPTGTFIVDEKEVGPHIFLAGGIGITPFRAIIKYNIDKNLKIPMHLIYSNSGSDFAFKKDLDDWQKNNDYIKVDYFDSSASGHLDKLKIEKLIGNWKFEMNNRSGDRGNLNWWLVGPPAFNYGMEETLEKMKIPEAKIVSEKFTGY